MASIAHDPKLVASLIEQLGGRVIEGETLRFDLKLSQVEKVVPKLNEWVLAAVAFRSGPKAIIRARTTW
jgi:lysophospholipid acyltransferase (LPLAT)-like uncharacterized protein